MQEEINMPVMTDRREVLANATATNLVSGKLHEFLSGPSIIKIYATAEGIGMNLSVLVGNETFCQDQEINAQNRMPLEPDDFLVSAAGVAGDRLVVSARNTTAGALDVFTRIEIEPVG